MKLDEPTESKGDHIRLPYYCLRMRHGRRMYPYRESTPSRQLRKWSPRAWEKDIITHSIRPSDIPFGWSFPLFSSQGGSNPDFWFQACDKSLK
jgi:hypothetical protein